MTVPAPSQYQKAISFIFHNTNGASVPREMVLPVKPEDLTIQNTSRLTIHQTLGGAFADNFGEGFPSMTIAGTTGWGSGNNTNGWDFFPKLKNFVYHNWHATRAAEIKKQGDPNKIKLVMNNQLDKLTWVVAPVSFQLKRHKHDPLLIYYNIQLAWLSDYLHDLNPLKNSSDILLNGMDSYDVSMVRLYDFNDVLKLDFMGDFNDITPNMRDVFSVTNNVSAQIKQLVMSTTTITAPLLDISSQLTQASAGILNSVMQVVGLPQQVFSQLIQVKNSYINLYCLMQNLLKPQKYLPNFDALLGASLCSSTSGGAPVSQYALSENTLNAVLPLADNKLLISSDAYQAATQIQRLDPVLNMVPLDQINTLASAISQGVRIY